jgi:hypothetical protein
MSSITPLIRTFQKGSFVTFQSAEEDMEFMFNDSGKKTKFSHFVLLNIPAIQTPTDNNNNIQFRNIEGNFTQGLSTATPYPQGAIKLNGNLAAIESSGLEGEDDEENVRYVPFDD